MPNSQLFYTQVMLGRETTWGTSVARTVSLPSDTPNFQPTGYRHIVDTGYRDQPSMEFDLISGPGEGGSGWNGNFYVDSTPNLLMALFGGTDTVTGAGPYTHSIPASKTPPSYSVEWGENNQPYLFAGARFSTFTLNFAARDGALTYTTQAVSKLGTTVSQTSFSASSVVSMAGWQSQILVGGSSLAAVLMDGSLTFTRPMKIVHGGSSVQDVANIYPGPLQIQCQLTIDFSDTVAYGYFQAATKNIVIIKFIQTANSAELWLTMSNAGWRMVTPQPQDGIYTAVAQINGLHNSTDAGPGAITVKNSQAGAY